MKYWVASLGFLIVLLVGIFVNVGTFVSRDRTDLGSINEVWDQGFHIPFVEIPLASNEANLERTYDLLQIDDFVSRQYTSGKDTFHLFVGYWKPGKTTQRMAAMHNPDICWVKSGGWTEIRRISSAKLEVKSLSVEIETPPASSSLLLAPIQYRLLIPPKTSGEDTQYHTYFWQVLEGEITPIEEIGPGSYWDYLKSIPERIRAKQHPMWFIRIHSKIPLAPVISNEELGDSTGPDQKYLIDYPEVRELLYSIHRLTTSEQMASE